MLIVVQGEAGEGKTMFVSRLLKKEYWDRGNEIYPNFKLWYDEEHTGITRWHALEDTYHLEKGVIVIDESIKVLDARRWRSLPQLFADKIAMHRHDHLDMIAIIQNLNDIDVRIRTNVKLLYTCQSMFRYPKSQRKKPILQIIRINKKKKVHMSDSNRIRWDKAGHDKIFFISKYFTKTYYDTHGAVGQNNFVCRIKMQRKGKKAEWKIKVFSRDLVNQGKARL